MERVEGNKTQAARELGLNSYQTLTNWMKRLGVE
jgi:DNA-binding protein Fis